MTARGLTPRTKLDSRMVRSRKPNQSGWYGVTPPQTVGPFFHGGMLHRPLNVMAAPDTKGEKIRIEGHVYDGDRIPVSDAVVEFWQANSAGRYRHPVDQRSIPIDETFAGFGRAGTDEDGAFWFETIKPGPVPFPGRGSQAPHINVAVFARGLLHHLPTRLYFEDDPAIREDPILQVIPERRRATLLAKRIPGRTPAYRFDINLQGDGETVFFLI